MPFKSRSPEGQLVDSSTINIFSKVSELTAPAAGFRIRRILGRSFGPGKKLVDVGTGPGSIPVELSKHYCDSNIFGLDVSLHMLKMAALLCRKNSLNIPLLAADGALLPFRSNSLNVLTSFFSLHHMDYPEKFLNEVERVLIPGGKVIIIDFRRDMARGLFLVLNAFWQFLFLFSSARNGFRDSVRSSWKPEEINQLIEREGLHRFQVHSNHLELWIRERPEFTGTA